MAIVIIEGCPKLTTLYLLQYVAGRLDQRPALNLFDHDNSDSFPDRSDDIDSASPMFGEKSRNLGSILSAGNHR